jgi:hypothetical protein
LHQLLQVRERERERESETGLERLTHWLLSLSTHSKWLPLLLPSSQVDIREEIEVQMQVRHGFS